MANDCIELDLSKIGLQVVSSCVYSLVEIVQYVTSQSAFLVILMNVKYVESGGSARSHMFMSPVLGSGISRELGCWRFRTYHPCDKSVSTVRYSMRQHLSVPFRRQHRVFLSAHRSCCWLHVDVQTVVCPLSVRDW